MVLWLGKHTMTSSQCYFLWQQCRKSIFRMYKNVPYISLMLFATVSPNVHYVFYDAIRHLRGLSANLMCLLLERYHKLCLAKHIITSDLQKQHFPLTMVQNTKPIFLMVSSKTASVSEKKSQVCQRCLALTRAFRFA